MAERTNVIIEELAEWGLRYLLERVRKLEAENLKLQEALKQKEKDHATRS